MPWIVSLKGWVLLVVPSCAIVALFLFSWAAFLLPNVPKFGLPFGYYGQFNRVKRELKDIPGIRIMSSHQHKDTCLEDFQFTVQTGRGKQLCLEFSHVDRTYELFKRADGLLVLSPDSGKWFHYILSSGGPLDVATRQEIRSAVHILENFDKIAPVINIDRREGSAELEWEDMPKGCLRIRYPIKLADANAEDS